MLLAPNSCLVVRQGSSRPVGGLWCNLQQSTCHTELEFRRWQPIMGRDGILHRFLNCGTLLGKYSEQSDKHTLLLGLKSFASYTVFTEASKKAGLKRNRYLIKTRQVFQKKKNSFPFHYLLTRRDWTEE